jgi:hypothetical protein
MTTVTHTQAGLRALAGVARLGAVTESCPTTATAHATQASLAAFGGFGHHQSASWTVDAIAKPNTYMVLDRKNRPTRQPSELSP